MIVIAPDSLPVRSELLPIPRVAVVIRSFTREQNLLRLLRLMARQTLPPVEIIDIDSGSDPAIVAQMREFVQTGLPGRDGAVIPFRLIEIPKGTFQSARALNQAFRHASAELVAILSQDALPASEHYLEKLIHTFDSEQVAGAYARQTLNGKYYPLGEKDLTKTYPSAPRVQTFPDCWFVNTCSVVRRSLWEAHPFDERAEISEDHEWAKWAQNAGYLIKYEPRAVVYHYHHFKRFRELWQRFYLEGKGLAYIHGRRISLPRAAFYYLREIVSDALWLWRKRIFWYWPTAVVRRAIKYAAFYKGHRDGQIITKN